MLILYYFQINLTVLDKNDNAPAFVFDDELSDLLSSNQYLVSIQDNTPVNSNILQIQVQFINVFLKGYVEGGGGGTLVILTLKS